VEAERTYAALPAVERGPLRTMKRLGFADAQLAQLRGESEQSARERRWAMQLRPVYKMVDTCAGEFPSSTPYLYSTYDDESEAPRSGRKSVVILGSGPNRIGQGVEFDYCCVRAAMALRDQGYETIMVNSNPETVSTDYDTSDKLYFEPLTLEHVLEIVAREEPVGVIVQLGGQTPLKLTRPLAAAGVPILGTSPDAIDIAEDRRRFDRMARELGIAQPANGTATSVEAAVAAATRIGYPVLVRPSYVLGGRAMEIVYDEATLRDYFARAVRVSEDRPVLIDSFLEDAYEADVDAISDGKRVVIGGVMQHIENAGIHSGDSACVLPPYVISAGDQAVMREHTAAFAGALGVVGLINVQFAIKDGQAEQCRSSPRPSACRLRRMLPA
jgi:carbamoyl-phosphate synthase large subunit